MPIPGNNLKDNLFMHPYYELGKIGYEAAAKYTNCTQSWEDANQLKWIASAQVIAEKLSEDI